jgi:hypothetical protein
MSAIVWATLLPDFKFLDVAPTAGQAYQMYEKLKTEIEGSMFEPLTWKMVEKPWPKIQIRYKHANGVLHNSILEFMSAADNAVRIKNYEGDWVNLDQAEEVPELLETIGPLGTRVRGQIKGRDRMGRLSLLANSEDNPELWYIFEMAEDYPKTYWSRQIASRSNKNITPSQMAAFIRRLGNDPKRIAQHLEGERPLGKGEVFPGTLVEPCIDDSLDAIMDHNLQAETPGFELLRHREAGTVVWRLPPEKDRTYVVCGDPGQSHPPLRNAPVVMTWDATDYPNTPMTLRAFWWGDGGGKYEPWVNQMLLWLGEYRALNGAYDSTGGQKVHSEMSFGRFSNVWPIDMSGIKKHSYINTLKLLLMKKRIRIPRGIKGITYQLGKYRLPDERLPQDLVSTLLVLAGDLWVMGFETVDMPRVKDGEAEEEPDESTPEGRYARRVRDRLARTNLRERPR